MMQPTPEQQADFLEKVLPLAEKLVASENFAVRKGNPVSRAINLAMGLSPRSKTESRLQEQLLAMVAIAYPDDEYPTMCAPSKLATTVH